MSGITACASGSPKPGIGRPQYSSEANEARFSRDALEAGQVGYVITGVKDVVARLFG